jgi:hypothetical protein
MWVKLWCKSWLTAAARSSRKASPRQRGVRPTLEVLEGRSLPSSLTLASVSPVTNIHSAAHSVLMAGKHVAYGSPGDPGPVGP